MTSEQSTRLNLLRFPLIVGVVFIHIYGSAVALPGSTIGLDGDDAFARIIQDLISQGVARIAVPLFFLMSGYLFFLGARWSEDCYLGKLRARVHTLLVPHLFWNLLMLAFIAAAQALPATRAYVAADKPIIAGFGAFQYLNAMLMPIAYQFWFIRDLMILALLTPVIHLLAGRAPVLFIGALFACWFLGLRAGAIPSIEGVLYFSIGCFCAMTRKSLFALDRHGRALLLLYAILLAASTGLRGTELGPYVHRAAIAAGVPTALWATSLVLRSRRLTRGLVALSGASFFVFAAHEPLLAVVKKLAYKSLQPEHPASITALYFLIPAATIVLALAAYHVLSRLVPGFTNLIAGGRRVPAPARPAAGARAQMPL